MKLIEARIQNYRSVADSTPFRVADVTCLVGKNESGKTNILRCLERLHALDPKVKKAYDEDMDWPRTSDDAPNPKAIVMDATWELESGEIAEIEAALGPACLKHRSITTQTLFNGSTTWTVSLDQVAIRGFLWGKFGVPPEEQVKVDGIALQELVGVVDADHKGNTWLKSVADYIRPFRDQDPELKVIDVIELPEMLYFASYDRLGGRISIEDLIHRRNQGAAHLTREHQLFLMFLDYAEVKPEELQNPKTAESHIAKLERAQNRITNKIFKYWTQNRELEVRFEALPGRPNDPDPFKTGTVFHTRIYNRLHRMTVPFDERSAGFTWFFSFLVQFTQLRDKHESLIILLDEPGGSLHGRAQQDLLRFIEEELKPRHQVIYTTHSPFMVPPSNLERVRVVEDVVVDLPDGNGRVSHGTKVGSDFMSVNKDTRFPLQGALGYEITQTLFIGSHSLLVEGPSDILYVQAASRALTAAGRAGIDKRWTVCPAGGVNKVYAFVSLFAGNAMKTALFVDLTTGPQGSRKEIEVLKKSGILEATRIFTAADFTSQVEADIEDMFGDAGFLEIVNAAFSLNGVLTASALAGAGEKSPRVLKKVETWFRTQAKAPDFDHYRPAEFLILSPDFVSKHAAVFAPALDRFEALFKKLNALL
jgi:hypothetical protein